MLQDVREKRKGAVKAVACREGMSAGHVGRAPLGHFKSYMS